MRIPLPPFPKDRDLVPRETMEVFVALVPLVPSTIMDGKRKTDVVMEMAVGVVVEVAVVVAGALAMIDMAVVVDRGMAIPEVVMEIPEEEEDLDTMIEVVDMVALVEDSETPEVEEALEIAMILEEEALETPEEEEDLEIAMILEEVALETLEEEEDSEIVMIRDLEGEGHVPRNVPP